MVFFGEYAVAFTGLGRIVLPKKIRELLHGSTFVVSKGFDTCLAGYDRQDWELRAKELLTVSLLEKENIEKRRYIFASASIVEIDDQGRFVVPKSLLDILSDNKKVVIIGVGDHFEIWNQEKWNKYKQEVQS